ncbi:MAG TPA: GlsB/YeaQ/YmgE family stress response membrane protein [Lacunisphaera sp.]|nr:GlsB/YeaQ/YmgE family stress response membrane protein [Lacunisphaera sp.]
MSILAIIAIGLVIGIVAKFLMPGNDPGGFIITAVLGIAGALLAGWVGRAAGWYGSSEPAGFVASVIGAVALLIVYRLLFRSRRLH